VSSFIIDSIYWCVTPEDFHGPWKQILEIVSRRNVYRYLFTLWRRLISSHVGPLTQRTTSFFRLEGPPSTVGERSKKTDIVCREEIGVSTEISKEATQTVSIKRIE
jgi:hypothetical protein